MTVARADQRGRGPEVQLRWVRLSLNSPWRSAGQTCAFARGRQGVGRGGAGLVGPARPSPDRRPAPAATPAGRGCPAPAGATRNWRFSSGAATAFSSASQAEVAPRSRRPRRGGGTLRLVARAFGRISAKGPPGGARQPDRPAADRGLSRTDSLSRFVLADVSRPSGRPAALTAGVCASLGGRAQPGAQLLAARAGGGQHRGHAERMSSSAPPGRSAGHRGGRADQAQRPGGWRRTGFWRRRPAARPAARRPPGGVSPVRRRGDPAVGLLRAGGGRRRSRPGIPLWPGHRRRAGASALPDSTSRRRASERRLALEVVGGGLADLRVAALQGGQVFAADVPGIRQATRPG